MGLGGRSSEDVHLLGHVLEKLDFTVMLGVSFIIKMPG